MSGYSILVSLNTTPFRCLSSTLVSLNIAQVSLEKLFTVVLNKGDGNTINTSH